MGVEADKAENCGNLTFGLLVAKKKKKEEEEEEKEQHSGSICEKNYREFYLFINIVLCFMIQKKLIKTT